MAKQKESKQKKMDVRVDFTPMVDMMMLLITFFMLCTSLSKPQTMQLTMPSNDKNLQDNAKNETKESQTVTVYVAGDDKIAYIEGIPNYNDPECLKETTWGKDGFRKVLMQHETEDGTVPVPKILAAKKKLDEDKLNNPQKYEGNDTLYDAQLRKIKAGEIDGEKVPTLTVIIKALDSASYKNVVDALDEMQILSIGTYVIGKVTPEDEALLAKKGIK